MSMYGTEKRQFVRIPLKVPVRYSFVSTESGAKIGGANEGNTHNISAGGLLVQGILPDFDSI